MASRNLLFLSYLFPPRGGAGVQRALKFVKYLPEFGYRPLVVANGGVNEDWVTKVQDPTLLKDIPQGTIVRRTQLNAAERKRFDRFQSKWRQRLEPTDPMRWWIEPAVRLALELHREHEAQAIFVTMSPFTSAEAGMRLKRLTGLPLILDLRDPWALDETRIYPTRLHAWRDWRAMQRTFSSADLIIMNTPTALAAARKAFDIRGKTELTCITNGFDSSDFADRDEALVPPPPSDVLRIVHTGMFHSELAEVWDKLARKQDFASWLKCARRPINLWTRTSRYLLAAIERVIAEGEIPAEKIDVVLVGELSVGDKALIERSGARKCVRMLGYRTHEASVQWLKSADLLFLPNHMPLDAKPALVVPGKTYEYLASRRPILALGGKGDMRQFIEECGAGVTVNGDDVAGAAEALKRFYKSKITGRAAFSPDVTKLARFDRHSLTERLARALDELISINAPEPIGAASPAARGSIQAAEAAPT